MIEKRISSKAILQQLTSSYGITIQNKSDCIEWIGDCMELIGLHVGFVNKFELVRVADFTIEQPVDFQSLNYIMLSNGQILREGNPIKINRGCVHNDFESDIYGLIEAKEHLECVEVDEFVKLTKVNCRTEVEFTQNKAAFLCRLDEQIYQRLSLVRKSESLSDSFYYYDNVSSWKTNFEGAVVVFYKAFPVDNNGYPIVIDEINYKMALRWYLLQCLMQNGLVHPLLKYPDVVTFANDYIHKASNQGAKFTVAQKESFISKWATEIASYYEN